MIKAFQIKRYSRDSYFASSSSPSSPIGIPTLFSTNLEQFPCSSSFIDLFTLICRYKDICEKLVLLIIPDLLANENSIFFIHRLKVYNSFYQDIFKMIVLYSDNILALDVCAASKKTLDNLFGIEIIDQVFSSQNSDYIWGCRHKLKDCKYKCNHYINKETVYISDKYEPVSKMMCVRINNINQVKELLKHFYQKYNNFMQKQYNHLLKAKNKKSNSLMQNFKFESYKTKVLFKSSELKLDKMQTGLIKLLAFRVIV